MQGCQFVLKDNASISFSFNGKFKSRYQRNNKKGGKKHLRCFPCCAPVHKACNACEVALEVKYSETGRLSKMYIAVARFLPLLDDGKTVALQDLSDGLGDIKVGAALTSTRVKELQRTIDHPLRPLYIAKVVDFPADHRVDFGFHEKAWHYGWKGGRYKASTRHVLRAYVLEGGPEIFKDGHLSDGCHALKCVAMISSPSFTIFSSRSAPKNKTVKKQLKRKVTDINTWKNSKRYLVNFEQQTDTEVSEARFFFEDINFLQPSEYAFAIERKEVGSERQGCARILNNFVSMGDESNLTISSADIDLITEPIKRIEAEDVAMTNDCEVEMLENFLQSLPDSAEEVIHTLSDDLAHLEEVKCRIMVEEGQQNFNEGKFTSAEESEIEINIARCDDGAEFEERSDEGASAAECCPATEIKRQIKEQTHPVPAPSAPKRRRSEDDMLRAVEESTLLMRAEEEVQVRVVPGESNNYDEGESLIAMAVLASDDSSAATDLWRSIKRFVRVRRNWAVAFLFLFVSICLALRYSTMFIPPRPPPLDSACNGFPLPNSPESIRPPRPGHRMLDQREGFDDDDEDHNHLHQRCAHQIADWYRVQMWIKERKRQKFWIRCSSIIFFLFASIFAAMGRSQEQQNRVSAHDNVDLENSLSVELVNQTL